MPSINDVRDALLTVTDNVYHYVAHKQTDDYVVYAEDGSTALLHEDNSLIWQAITGTVDYYTRQEDNPQVRAISNALTSASVPHKINSVQYENDTGYIHYEWVWEIGTNDI